MPPRTTRRLLLACLLGGLLTPGAGRAQSYLPYGPYAPYGNQYRGAGGQLHGYSDMLNAVGNLTIDQEKARVERETANQAKLDTRKKALDQMLYEKAYTPTSVET